MTGDGGNGDRIARRVAALRAAVADRRTSAPSIASYSSAHRALRPAGHVHGVLLLAAASACAPDATDEDAWLPAGLAVDYLDAFARTHRQAIESTADATPNDGRPARPQPTDGILAGDLLFSRAHELLLDVELTQTTRRACLETITTAGRRLCEGAARRRELLQADSIDVRAYETALERDGGVLSMASARLGGLLGGATDDRLEHLAAFGRNLGVAIQLVAGATASADHAPERPSRSTGLLDVCIETSRSVDAALIARRDASGGTTRALCRRAEQRLSAATEHLDAVTASNERPLLTDLLARVRSASPSDSHGALNDPG
ncbi:MAG: polyprenyl synthetase family protein [Haloarculaceae archaeon]